MVKKAPLGITAVLHGRSSRVEPYPYIRWLAASYLRGDSTASRLTLNPGQEPALARREAARVQTNHHSLAGGITRYQGSLSKVPGVHFVPVPHIHPNDNIQFSAATAVAIEVIVYAEFDNLI